MFSVFSVFRRNIDVPRAAYSCTIDRIVKVLPVGEHRGIFYNEIGQTKSKGGSTYEKSLLAILLAVAMMLTAFAGCGSSAAPAGESSVSAALASAEDAAEAGNGTAESPEVAASPEEPAVAESAEAGEASNGEAETAEFEGNPPIEYPLVDELYTISYMQAWPPFLNEISEPSDAAMFQELEEATGISLDFISVSTETAADDFMLCCATNDLPDMIQNGDTRYTGGAKAIEDEILLDLYAQLGLTVTDPKSPPFGTYARRAHQDPPPNAEFGGGNIYYHTPSSCIIMVSLFLANIFCSQISCHKAGGHGPGHLAELSTGIVFQEQSPATVTNSVEAGNLASILFQHGQVGVCNDTAGS